MREEAISVPIVINKGTFFLWHHGPGTHADSPPDYVHPRFGLVHAETFSRLTCRELSLKYAACRRWGWGAEVFESLSKFDAPVSETRFRTGTKRTAAHCNNCSKSPMKGVFTQADYLTLAS